MKKYRITVKHDSGAIDIITTASCEESVVAIICNTELCPESAIKKIKLLKTLW